MNYMKEVAEMLGVEIGEYFHVTGFGNTRFAITNGGMFYGNEDNEWEESLVLYDILKGIKQSKMYVRCI